MLEPVQQVVNILNAISEPSPPLEKKTRLTHGSPLQPHTVFMAGLLAIFARVMSRMRILGAYRWSLVVWREGRLVVAEWGWSNANQN